MTDKLDSPENMAAMVTIDRVAARNILRILGREDYALLVKTAAAHRDSQRQSPNFQKRFAALQQHEEYAHLSDGELSDVVRDSLVDFIIVSAADKLHFCDPRDPTHASWNGLWPERQPQ